MIVANLFVYKAKKPRSITIQGTYVRVKSLKV